MTREIRKPSQRRYWVVRGPGVLHVGVTEPGQVTSTGQPEMIDSDTPENLRAAIATRLTEQDRTKVDEELMRIAADDNSREKADADDAR